MSSTGATPGDFARAWTPGERGLLTLVADLAPSVHNTQPWQLSFHDDIRVLSLLERRERALPHHDPLGRDRLISLGAALTNVHLALRVLGWVPEVSLLPDPACRDEVARIIVRERCAPSDDEVARYVAESGRHSYREPFLEARVGDATVRRLTAHGVDGVDGGDPPARRGRGRRRGGEAVVPHRVRSADRPCLPA